MLHIWAICFEHREVVTCERHVVIFLKTAKGVMFDINFMFCIVYIYIYMGSSSLVVLIGSHSLCNSFVVNQFFISHQMEKIPFVIHPRSNESNLVEKICFVYFFISKIYSHVTQKWWPKTGIAIPYCLCWKLLHTRRKYSDISNLFAKLQHAKAPES